MPTGDTSYNFEPVHQPVHMPSRSSLSSDIPVNRRPSHSPRVALSAPPVRDRTSIRHNRPSVTRGRSHSKEQMLLAYAAEQNQLHQTQSLPSRPNVSSQNGANAPHMYNMTPYNMSPPIGSFTQQNGYFGTPATSSTGRQDTDFSIPQNEGDLQGFYPVGRTSSHSSAMSFPPNELPNALYMHSQPPHAQQPLPPIGMAMQPFPPVSLTLESTPAEIEIMPSRPKPQCWDHGCNGRQFSTFSNLLRHQREKSGSAVKAICPHCGTEFTRTTARNGHMSGGKCKGRPDAEAPTGANKE